MIRFALMQCVCIRLPYHPWIKLCANNICWQYNLVLTIIRIWSVVGKWDWKCVIRPRLQLQFLFLVANCQRTSRLSRVSRTYFYLVQKFKLFRMCLNWLKHYLTAKLKKEKCSERVRNCNLHMQTPWAWVTVSCEKEG